MSVNQTSKPNITVNLPQILDLGCGVIQQVFFRQKEEQAKRAFKTLKHGELLNLGNLTLEAKDGDPSRARKLKVSLELKHSEFRGPGFGFPIFRVALQGLLERIATTLRARKDLNVLTNQATGGVLIHHPGVVQTGEQINVLCLALEPGDKGFIFRLMFVDPDQYRIKQGADENPESNSAAGS